MSRAQTFTRVELEDLRRGDKVIVIRDSSYLPSDIHVETFHSVRVEARNRIRVRLRDKGSKHDLFVDQLDMTGWRFYRKVKQ